MGTAATPSLTGLPSEILLFIMGMCDAVSAVRCGMTCRRMQEVVQSSEVQYAIMLEIGGMYDTGIAPGEVSIPDRLALLRDYDRSWRTLGSPNCLQFQESVTRVTHIDIKEGVLVVIAHDGVLDNNRPAVVVHVLPSKLRGIEHTTWQWPCSVDAQRLLIGPTWDLVLLTTYSQVNTSVYFHPFQLSTGETHPLAKGPFAVEIPFPYFLSARYSVCESSLALYCAPVQLLIVINWKTGAVIARLSDTPQCMLFGEDLILNCRRPTSDLPASVMIYRIDLSTADLDPKHISTLFLPHLAQDVVAFDPPGNFVPALRGDGGKHAWRTGYFQPILHPYTYVVFKLRLTYLRQYEVEIPMSVILSYSETTPTPGRDGTEGRNTNAAPREIHWGALLASGAVIRPAISPATTCFHQNSRRFIFRPARMQTPYHPRFQYVDYAHLRVARARCSGVREVRTEDDAAQVFRLVDGDVFVMKSANPYGGTAAFIDARPAPASIFSPGDGIHLDGRTLGGEPAPRLVIVGKPPEKDKKTPTGEPHRTVALDTSTNDGFVLIHAGQVPNSAVFTTYSF